MGIENVNVSDLLKELADGDAIRQFDVDGKAFGAIRNFRKFQSPQKPRNIHRLAPGIADYVGLKKAAGEDKSPDSNGQGNDNVQEEYGTPTVPVQASSHTERRGEDDGKGEELSQSLRSCDFAQAQAPAPKPEQAAGKLKKPKREFTQIAPDALPNERQIADAKAAGYSREQSWELWCSCRDHHAARGTKFRDWEAAWRTWLRNAPRFGVPLAAVAKGLADYSAERPKKKNLYYQLAREAGDLAEMEDNEQRGDVDIERLSAAHVAGLSKIGGPAEITPSAGRPDDLLHLRPLGSG
jgi:hypothetical protein